MLDFPAIRAIRTDAFAFLRQTSQKFDIIFADPPYDMEEFEIIPGLVFEKELLAGDGWLVIEHPREKNFSDHPNLFDRRKYGKVNFSFFK
jgi:16S rRNA G966 N2-methylase RsmD